jgi:cytosine/adenosine deaminase-related metal-dependent hydrolase
MFEEMRALAQKEPWLAARKIIEMATLNGARALGSRSRIGELSEKAFADLIAIPFAGKANESYHAILEHRGEVAASMINGRWAVPPA